MKKKYNPFKMWGSYIGFLIGFLWVGLRRFSGFGCSERMGILVFTQDPTCVPLFLISALIPGFFIGWGINAWIRKR